MTIPKDLKKKEKQLKAELKKQQKLANKLNEQIEKKIAEEANLNENYVKNILNSDMVTQFSYSYAHTFAYLNQINTNIEIINYGVIHTINLGNMLLIDSYPGMEKVDTEYPQIYIDNYNDSTFKLEDRLAGYFMRTPSDAPRNYVVQTIKYITNDLIDGKFDELNLALSKINTNNEWFLALKANVLNEVNNFVRSQKGFGVTPILGIDFKMGQWNVAAKYEFRTKLNLKNKSNNSANVDALMPEYKDGASVRSDIPALFTIGVQYSPIKSLRLSGGFHHYHDKAAKGSATDVKNNTIEGLFGIEYDAHKIVTISAGMQRTKFGFSDEQVKDTNFNLSAWSLGVGAQFNCTSFMKVNVGYFHTFYDERTVENANNIATLKNTYNRTNDLVGASIDFKF